MQRPIRSRPSLRQLCSLRRRAAVAAAILALMALLLTACDGSGSSSGAAGGRLRVVAAENFWGSIAGQLGGDRVDVSSIIVNPDIDPHSYEPSARDARTMAGAQLAIVNGVGYDGWAQRLLSAEPADDRSVLDVGDLLGLARGANPHRWYFPADVRAVIGAIVAAYDRLDPGGAAYFAASQAPLRKP